MMMCFFQYRHLSSSHSDLFTDNIGPITDTTIVLWLYRFVHDAERFDCLRASVKHHLSASSLCLFRQFSRFRFAAPDRRMVGF